MQQSIRSFYNKGCMNTVTFTQLYLSECHGRHGAFAVPRTLAANILASQWSQWARPSNAELG